MAERERERETASNGSGADPSTQKMHTQHKTKGMHTNPRRCTQPRAKSTQGMHTAEN